MTIIPSRSMLSQFQMPKIQWIFVHVPFYLDMGYLFPLQTIHPENDRDDLITLQLYCKISIAFRICAMFETALRTNTLQAGEVAFVSGACMFFYLPFPTYKWGSIFYFKAGTYFMLYLLTFIKGSLFSISQNDICIPSCYCAVWGYSIQQRFSVLSFILSCQETYVILKLK